MRIKIRTEFYIILSSACFLLDYRWVLGWIIAAAVHELFHCLALILCRQEICSIEIGMWGAEIMTDAMSARKEVICALAGPVGGLLCLLCSKIFPRLAVCAFVQSAFNLLPVYPLDGGRALRCFLELIAPKRYSALARIIEGIISAGMMIAAAYFTFFLRLGYLPVTIAAAIVFRNGKIPCKLPTKQVQ